MINLESKTIRLRLVEENDAKFILSLRLDHRYNQFLSHVNNDLAGQIQWIQQYKVEEAAKNQFYFIIERLDGTPCGTIRVYDLRSDSFCWGSWILNENKTHYAALESAFLVYQFGFDYLDYQKSHFDVMKGNSRVVSFHEKMGAILTHEDLDNFYYTISQDSVNKKKHKLKEKIKP